VGVIFLGCKKLKKRDVLNQYKVCECAREGLRVSREGKGWRSR
jgi:hypothetical protein